LVAHYSYMFIAFNFYKSKWLNTACAEHTRNRNFREMNIPLTNDILQDLKCKGYNILKSENTVEDTNQYFVPIKVNDLWRFLEEFNKDSATIVVEDILHVSEGALEGKFIRVF